MGWGISSVQTQEVIYEKIKKKNTRILIEKIGNKKSNQQVGIGRKLGMGVYTLLHFKWITNKALQCTGNSAQCSAAGWMGRESGGEWIHVYVWLSPFAIHLKLWQHCWSATLQYKRKSFFYKAIITARKKEWLIVVEIYLIPSIKMSLKQQRIFWEKLI